MRFNENRIKIKNIDIHYLREGSGKPLLLIHGGNSDAYSAWEKNISYLSEKREVFSINLPGFGKSEKPKLNYNSEFFVEVIDEFTKKFGVENCSVIGNSMGGALSFAFAAYSDYVDKVVLVNSYGINKSYKYIQKPIYVLLNIPFLINNLGWGLQQLIDKHWIEWAFFKWLKNDWGWKKLKTNLIDLEGKIKSPILVIYGKNDFIIPHKVTKKICLELENCVFKSIEGSGHLPQREKPKEFNKIVYDFLED